MIWPALFIIQIYFWKIGQYLKIPLLGNNLHFVRLFGHKNGELHVSDTSLTIWWNYTLIQTFCMTTWWNYAIINDNRPLAHKRYNTNSDDHEDSWSKMNWLNYYDNFIILKYDIVIKIYAIYDAKNAILKYSSLDMWK